METLIKKIASKESKFGQSFVTKSGNLSANVVNAIDNSRFEGNKIYTKSWSGSGRHINLKDHSFYITTLLNRLGYKYKTGNDAPRGGQEGDFIKVSKVALNALNSLIS